MFCKMKSKFHLTHILLWHYHGKYVFTNLKITICSLYILTIIAHFHRERHFDRHSGRGQNHFFVRFHGLVFCCSSYHSLLKVYCIMVLMILVFHLQTRACMFQILKTISRKLYKIYNRPAFKAETTFPM